MIKLINKENAVVGMVVNVWNKDGGMRSENITIEKIGNITICNHSTCYLIDKYYFELVSMPERRLLTWEYVKEHIDELPFKIYNTFGTEIAIRFANKDQLQTLSIFNWDEIDYLFIDPLLPEIPEVSEPWLVKAEPKQKSLWWLRSEFDNDYLAAGYLTKSQLINTTKGDLPVEFCKFQPYNAESQFAPIESKWESV